jgi:NMD protein affecting ribosome stability and mRNA decay
MDTIVTLPRKGICAECGQKKNVLTDGMIMRHDDSRNSVNIPKIHVTIPPRCPGSGRVPAHYLYELRLTVDERHIILDALDYYSSVTTVQDVATAQMIATSLDPRRRHATEDDQD